jgi:hypothetical protein
VEKALNWLLQGDVSIQYLTHLYLLNSDSSTLARLQSRIPEEGFAARLLACQNPNGHWGNYYYQPKWTSTHYTLLDLQSLNVPKSQPQCREMVSRMFDECLQEDGGLNLAKSELPSDTCVDGMILNYSAYFCVDDPRITRLIDHLLSVQTPDGGFTWDRFSHASEPHTTLCVLEGIGQCLRSGIQHRTKDIRTTQGKAVEYLLSKLLFIEEKDRRFRKLSFPYRYRYDLLRVLEYFAKQDLPYDLRMQLALDWLQSKRKSDGHWYLENIHPAGLSLSKPCRF